MDEKYWSEAKNKGYVVRSRTEKSLSWCFMNKRKLFNGKAFDILKQKISYSPVFYRSKQDLLLYKIQV